MPPNNLLQNRSILEAALAGLELQRQRLESNIATVRAQLGVRRGRLPDRKAADKQAAEAPSKTVARKRPKISAAGRRRIAAAQRKRWAALKKAKSAAPKKTVAKKSATKAGKKD